METKKQNMHDVYQLVTDCIIEKINDGIIPWQRPWTVAGPPQNLITGTQYHGINALLLASLGYPTNLFLTFKQTKGLGAHVKKGEKSHPVVYWKINEPKEDSLEAQEDKTERKTGYLRYYSVFNIAQCEDIPEDKIPEVVNIRQAYPIPACEKIVEDMPECPEIRHNEQAAYYNPVFDFINMPEKQTFISQENYYSTLFHELVHSTGNASRLNRKELMEKGTMKSESYSLEELTAEIGACFLNAYAGIAETQIDNSMAYLQGWLARLQNDKRFIVYAASRAQRAVDFILNLKPKKSVKPLPIDEKTEIETEREPESHPTFVRH